MPLISAGLNLALRTVEPQSAGKSLSLFVHGATGSGSFKSLDLFLACVSGIGNLASSNIPLTLVTADSAVQSATLPLFVDGVLPSLTGLVSLYLKNTQTVASSGMSMFVAGLGTTDGYIPFSASLPLFLRRNVVDVIPLFVQGPGNPVSSSLALSITGAIPVSGIVPLVMPNTACLLTKSTTLYVHGY